VRRRLLLSLGLLILLALLGLALVVALIPEHPGVTLANFERIEQGMCLSDTIAILGPDVMLMTTEVSTTGQWRGDMGAIVIIFDDGGRVRHKLWTAYSKPILERLRSWLGL
jgi:hypothetical protein